MQSKTTSVPAIPPLNRLTGRRIVVTGAGSGIGAAIAQLFISEGAKVAALDRNEAGILSWMKSGEGIALPVDVSDEKQVNDAVHRAVQAM